MMTVELMLYLFVNDESYPLALLAEQDEETLTDLLARAILVRDMQERNDILLELWSLVGE